MKRAARQAQYAYDYNSPYGLSPEAKVIYERLVAEGGVARRPAEYTNALADPLAGITQRTPPRSGRASLP
jgi:hypothetical protein